MPKSSGTTMLIGILLVALALIVGGCASTSPRGAFEEVHGELRQRGVDSLYWHSGVEEDREVAATIEQLLKQDLTVESAVRITLLNNRRLQSVYQTLGIAQADLVQAGLLSNPVFAGVNRVPVARSSVKNRSVTRPLRWRSARSRANIAITSKPPKAWFVIIARLFCRCVSELPMRPNSSTMRCRWGCWSSCAPASSRLKQAGVMFTRSTNTGRQGWQSNCCSEEECRGRSRRLKVPFLLVPVHSAASNELHKSTA